MGNGTSKNDDVNDNFDIASKPNFNIKSYSKIYVIWGMEKMATKQSEFCTGNKYGTQLVEIRSNIGFTLVLSWILGNKGANKDLNSKVNEYYDMIMKQEQVGPILIIGFSMGAVIARHLFKRLPHNDYIFVGCPEYEEFTEEELKMENKKVYIYNDNDTMLYTSKSKPKMYMAGLPEKPPPLDQVTYDSKRCILFYPKNEFCGLPKAVSQGVKNCHVGIHLLSELFRDPKNVVDEYYQYRALVRLYLCRVNRGGGGGGNMAKLHNLMTYLSKHPEDAKAMTRFKKMFDKKLHSSIYNPSSKQFKMVCSIVGASMPP